jgi:hypothetical protein
MFDYKLSMGAEYRGGYVKGGLYYISGYGVGTKLVKYVGRTKGSSAFLFEDERGNVYQETYVVGQEPPFKVYSVVLVTEM